MWPIKHRLGGRLKTQMLVFRLCCDGLHGGKWEMPDNEVKGWKLREHKVWEETESSSLECDKSRKAAETHEESPAVMFFV